MDKMSEISFRYSHVTEVQLPMVTNWLSEPHVSEWFHGEGLQNTLKGLDDFVRNRSKDSTYWIGSIRGNEPFSLLITSFADPNDRHYKLVPFKGKTVVTLDILIGKHDYLGKGYGTRLILDFLKDKFPQAKK